MKSSRVGRLPPREWWRHTRRRGGDDQAAGAVVTLLQNKYGFLRNNANGEFWRKDAINWGAGPDIFTLFVISVFLTQSGVDSCQKKYTYTWMMCLFVKIVAMIQGSAVE